MAYDKEKLGEGAMGKVVRRGYYHVEKLFTKNTDFNTERDNIRKLFSELRPSQKAIFKRYTLLSFDMASGEKWNYSTADNHHIVYKNCQGQTLTSYMKKVSKLPVGLQEQISASLFVETATAVLSVIGVLRNKNFKHCDIKLDNLMYCETDAMPGVRVVDFGFMTSNEMCKSGTPFYLPESAGIVQKLLRDPKHPVYNFLTEVTEKVETKSAPKIDPDLYALGICLLYMYPKVRSSAYKSFWNLADGLLKRLLLNHEIELPIETILKLIPVLPATTTTTTQPTMNLSTDWYTATIYDTKSKDVYIVQEENQGLWSPSLHEKVSTFLRKMKWVLILRIYKWDPMKSKVSNVLVAHIHIYRRKEYFETELKRAFDKVIIKRAYKGPISGPNPSVASTDAQSGTAINDQSRGGLAGGGTSIGAKQRRKASNGPKQKK
jgi:serine/threonine protein kinase